MAVVLVVEDGSGLANANSYVSLEEFNAHHEVNLFTSDLLALTDEVKTKLVIMATRQVDVLVRWRGEPTYPGVQALRFPRTGVVDADGIEVPDNTIPKYLKAAICEMAAHLNTTNPTEDPDGYGLESFALEGMEFVFDKTQTKGGIPRNVAPLLKGLADPSSGPRTSRVVAA